MATQIVTALFDTYAGASTAVSKLEQSGIPHEAISIVSNDPTHQETLATHESAAGTSTGASLGTVLGGGAGLLAGLGMLAIPGLGPVVAAGWLAATLVGAGVGAAAGGIVGSLTDAGISHDDAHTYAEGIGRGGTLVTVRADENLIAQAKAILDTDGTVDIGARDQEWRDNGWNGTYAGTDPVSGASQGLVQPAAPVRTTPMPGEAAPGSRVRVYGDGI